MATVTGTDGMRHSGVPVPRLRIDRRRKAIALVALCVSACAGVTLVLITRDPFSIAGIFDGGSDEDVYREGALRALSGQPLYAGPVLYGLMYTYPPFSALAFIPLGLLPRGDKVIWLAVNVVLLGIAIGYCLRLLGYRRSWFTAGVSALLALTSVFLEPVRTTLQFGQINIVLMLLVLWDVSRGECSRIRGVATGLASGIKLTPLYFVLYYAATRRWRAAVTAVAAFLGTVAVAWAVLPSDSARYWTETFFESGRIADDGTVANQSLRGMIARFLGEPAPIWLWLLAAALTCAVSMFVASRLLRSGRALLAVTLVGLTARMISPFSWSHHWVWFVPVLVYLVHRAMTGRGWWWIAAAGWFLALGAWIKIWPEAGFVSPGLYLFARPAYDFAFLFLSNLYCWVYFAVLAILAVYAAVLFRRTRASRRPGKGGAGARPLPRLQSALADEASGGARQRVRELHRSRQELQRP